MEPVEITISLPCGNIAGKWWGPKDIRPILCLHGWQDNAGTFDRLIPLLPNHVSYLAIDLPGHGHSFRFPAGLVYNFNDLMLIVRLIVDLYQWKKVSFLAHSMGVFAAFLYSGFYSNDVDLVVALDTIQPLCKPPDVLYNIMRNAILDNVKFEMELASGREPPSYKYDEAVNRTIEGFLDDSVTPEVIPYLLKRGIKRSPTDPTKYAFTRDTRVKCGLIRIYNVDFSKYLVSNMKMPYLYIKSKNSKYYEPKENHDKTLAAFKQSNPNFEYQLVEGGHHVHLSNPENVSGHISDLILRARPVKSGADNINKNYYINCKL